jgi:hypothetical protein
MILILGDPADRLVLTVRRQLDALGVDMTTATEGELLGSTPLALESHEDGWSGYLCPGDDRLSLSDVSGVVLRLPRSWWPDPEFSLQDQMFVYHETTAAWFCLFANLRCPVMNRFGLGWWLREVNYPTTLCLELADALGIGIAYGRLLEPRPLQLDATGPPSAGDLEHVYAVGGRVISEKPESSEAAAMLDELGPELGQWQRASGILMCRLDFSRDGQNHLAYVEPSPRVEAESPQLVDRIAAAMVEVLT